MRIAVTALLVLYAAAVPTAGSRLLSRAAWPQQVPRAGIAAWLAAALSAVVSAALAGLVAAIPCLDRVLIVRSIYGGPVRPLPVRGS